MSFKTLEVELENGRVHPAGLETLPERAHALLTLLESDNIASASTCAELAARWPRLEKLTPEEAAAFADDIERSRSAILPLKPAWD